MKPIKENLEKVFSKKEILKFNKLKSDLPKSVFIFRGIDDLESFKNSKPEYFYDKDNDMLYKKISSETYKHVA